MLKLVQENKLIFLCFLIAIVFLFKNLGNIYLWNDEAETALLAINTLKYKVPVAYDGNFLVQQNNITPYKSAQNKIWIFHPWLQFYLTAASFKFLGISTFSARFPFAVIGLLIITVLGRSTYKNFDHKFISPVSVALLVSSIPFYLYMRQCRYYALATLFTLLSTDAFYDFIERKRSFIPFVIFSSLLFYSFYPAFFAIFLGFFLYFLLYFNKEATPKLLGALASIGLLTIPGAIYFEVWRRKEVVYSQETISLFTVSRRLFQYLLHINSYCLPVFIFVFLLFIIKKDDINNLFKNKFLILCLSIILATILFFSFISLHSFRLIIQILPLCMIVLAFILQRIYLSRLSLLFPFFLVTILLGNYLNILPYFAYEIVDLFKLRKTFYYYKLKSYSAARYSIFDYAYEITHDYDGPNEGISQYINKHASPGDTISITYGDLPLAFYTRGKFNIGSRIFFGSDTEPDWWIFRGGRWYYSGEESLKKYQPILQEKYEKIEINYPNIPWGNLPDPGYHKFSTVKDAPRVVIYRRKRQNSLSSTTEAQIKLKVQNPNVK